MYKVVGHHEFKTEYNLMKLFAMPSRAGSAADPPEEGIDEGVPTDDEAEYIRSCKTADLEAEARSVQHQFCHYPKNPFCKVCQRARMMAPPAKKKGGQKRLDTKSFGDHIVADHTVIKANVEEGVKGETVA